MFISQGKKRENVAEYLLYMWQIEDLIRAFSLDIDKIQENIINQYNCSQEKKKELRDWYESLIDMMRRENVQKSGHLQLNKNVITQMNDLHESLMSNPKESSYIVLYNKTLPLIMELMAKNGNKKESEIETCMEFLYGILLLKIQKKEISEGTKNATKSITEYIRFLSVKFKEELTQRTRE